MLVTGISQPYVYVILHGQGFLEYLHLNMHVRTGVRTSCVSFCASERYFTGASASTAAPTRVCVNIYIYIYIYTFVHINVHTLSILMFGIYNVCICFVRTNTRTCLSTVNWSLHSVRMQCMYVSFCICICRQMFIHKHKYKLLYIHIQTRTCKYRYRIPCFLSDFWLLTRFAKCQFQSRITDPIETNCMFRCLE